MMPLAQLCWQHLAAEVSAGQAQTGLTEGNCQGPVAQARPAAC